MSGLSYRHCIISVFVLYVISGMLLAACEPRIAVVETPAVSGLPAGASVTNRASVIRLAILSDISSRNVWAIYNEAGTSYWNLAVQGSYWPSLYRLSDQRHDFIPYIADGFPSAFTQEGDFITATVRIRPGLAWTDGSVLTAEDAAFTANAVLAFHLRLDWEVYYNPDFLDHVEALDANTLKYYFKKSPGLAVWQYGALQAPIVNKTYWESRIADAEALLPSMDTQSILTHLEIQASALQKEIDQLNVYINLLDKRSSEYKTKVADVNRKRNDLNGVESQLESRNAEYAGQLGKAQEVLFKVDNTGEPTFGPWESSRWEVGNNVENAVNPNFFFSGTVIEEYASGAYREYKEDGSYELIAYGEPTGDKVLAYRVGPYFNNALYTVYANEAAAVTALRNNEVDLILNPDGLSPDFVAQLSNDPDIKIVQNGRGSLRYLAFNHARFYMADKALHQALACMFDLDFISRQLLQGQAQPAYTLVPATNRFWFNPDVPRYCAGEDARKRMESAVGILKDAGYTWDQEPIWNEASLSVEAGQGLKMPGGEYFPEVALLAPDSNFDPLRAATALYIEKSARSLGIPLTVTPVGFDEIILNIYGTGNYDMALLGWRLGNYPDYLCTFFDQVAGNPYNYTNDELRVACNQFLGETNFANARRGAFEIQKLLAADMPFITLFVNVIYDAYRNIEYPYTQVLNGIGPGMYGAPSIAIPVGQ